jgi:hypothetical protein
VLKLALPSTLRVFFQVILSCGVLLVAWLAFAAGTRSSQTSYQQTSNCTRLRNTLRIWIWSGGSSSKAGFAEICTVNSGLQKLTNCNDAPVLRYRETLKFDGSTFLLLNPPNKNAIIL